MAELGAPINYYGMVPDFRGEALKETQNRLGQAQLQGLNMENQYAQQQMSERQAFQQELPTAINDPAKMQALAVKYPTQVKSISDQLAFKSGQEVAALGSAVSAIETAAAMKNPEAMASALTKYAPVLQSKGVTPQQLMQMWVNDPRQLNNIIGQVKMGMLGAKDQFDVQDKQQGRQLTASGQDMTAATAARGQAITMRGQDIQADLGLQRLAFDRDTNRINIENKRLDRQLSSETNDLKKQEIQQRITSNNQKLQQKQQDLNSGYRDSINTLTTSMGTLNDIVTSPALKSITGIRGAIPNVPGSDAADVQARLDTFKSQAFLSAVSAMKGMGALSDAEGKKLDAAVGSLQNSQSEDAFKRNANVIMSMYNQKRNDAVNKYTQQNGIKRVEAPSASVEYLKSHPELSADFINRYGYLPKLGG